MLIFWLNAAADRVRKLITQLVFPDHWTIQAKHGKKACVCEESCGSKKASFKRTKHTLNCHVTGHLSWAPSDVTCRNEEHHENMEEAGKTDSSTSGDSAHLSLNHYVCTKRI
jgi:hypothetical protein